MTIQHYQYEELLARYTDHGGMLALLKRVRPYLEMLPSMRRPSESLITIPLPIIRVRESVPSGISSVSNLGPGDATRVPCDIAVLMCDPDWKIKTGVEIFVFIHRPNEDFSELLGRWRQTQLWINKGYDWFMPPRYRHIYSEGAEEAYALFVISPDTPERIRKGLNGAALPYVIDTVTTSAPPLSSENDAKLDFNTFVLDADENYKTDDLFTSAPDIAESTNFNDIDISPLVATSPDLETEETIDEDENNSHNISD